MVEIKKWHVYTADLNPRFGTEAGKIRPVLVVQTNLLNDVSHPSTLICPITTSITPKAVLLRIHLREHEAGLRQASDVLIDQLRAIDNKRLKTRLGVISKENQIKLTRSLKAVLDL